MSAAEMSFSPSSEHVSSAICGKVVVIGLGRSGSGAARLLKSLGRSVCLIESRSTPPLQDQAEELRHQGIAVHLGVPLTREAILDLASPVERVILSPGIRWDHPELEALRSDGVTVQGEVIPAWESSRPVPWIGITGTNGKTTVTHLVHHLLAHGGLDAPMAGNVGFSAAEVVLQRQQSGVGLPEWMVVELSSYQIEAAQAVSPQVGIWTTLTPDHLERHGSLGRYRAIKRSLLERSAVQVLNGDDPDLRGSADSWDHARWVTAGPRQELAAGVMPVLWIQNGRIWHQPEGWDTAQDLMAADALAMPGEHNRQNMLLAVAAGLEAGLDGPSMEAALRSFPGVPHRLELILERGGVAFYNDSKATNFDAALVALRSLQPPLIVLAGGQAKIGDAQPWVEALCESAGGVLLYGEAGDQFATRLHEGGFSGRLQRVETLDQAVPLAEHWARDLSCRAVLLSPACASFDQYSDFEARGEHFRQLVLNPPGSGSGGTTPG